MPPLEPLTDPWEPPWPALPRLPLSPPARQRAWVLARVTEDLAFLGGLSLAQGRLPWVLPTRAGLLRLLPHVTLSHHPTPAPPGGRHPDVETFVNLARNSELLMQSELPLHRVREGRVEKFEDLYSLFGRFDEPVRGWQAEPQVVHPRGWEAGQWNLHGQVPDHFVENVRFALGRLALAPAARPTAFSLLNAGVTWPRVPAEARHQIEAVEGGWVVRDRQTGALLAGRASSENLARGVAWRMYQALRSIDAADASGASQGAG